MGIFLIQLLWFCGLCWLDSKCAAKYLFRHDHTDASTYVEKNGRGVGKNSIFWYSSRIITCFQKVTFVFFLVCEQLWQTNQQHHKVTVADNSKLTHKVFNRSTEKLLDIKMIQLKLLELHTVCNILPLLSQKCISTVVILNQQVPQHYNRHVTGRRGRRGTAPNSSIAWGWQYPRTGDTVCKKAQALLSSELIKESYF